MAKEVQNYGEIPGQPYLLYSLGQQQFEVDKDGFQVNNTMETVLFFISRVKGIKEKKGHIVGNIENGVFDVELFMNDGTLPAQPTQHLPGHVYGVVRETLAQVLIQDKVSEVIFSGKNTVLTDAGTFTFDKLIGDPRLIGKKTQLARRDDNTGSYQFSYSIRKR